MSRENVELFHRIHADWHRHHRIGAGLLDEDVEWINPPYAVEPGTRRGIEGFNEAIESVFDAWDEWRFEPQRLLELDGDVLALGQVSGRSQGAGVEITRPHAQIWSFRDGKATRCRWFHGHEEALEAAGVRD